MGIAPSTVTVKLHPENANVHGDGVVDRLDGMLILQCEAGMSIELE